MIKAAANLPPITPLFWFAASSPVILLFILMLYFRWGARRAGPISWITAALIGTFVFGADEKVIAVASAKGMWVALWVSYIFWPALLIYQLMAKVGALDQIQNKFRALSGSRILQLLIVGWVFPSFLQGVTGFGTPVVVTAPLLLGMGFSPLIAATTPLIGHAWAVTFGSLGSSYHAARLVTELTPAQSAGFANWAALLLSITCLLTGFTIAYLYKGVRGLRKGFPAALILGLTMGGVINLTVRLEPSIATFVAGIVGLGVGYLLTKSPWYRRGKLNGARPEGKKGMGFNLSFLPYYLIVGLVLLVMLPPPLASKAKEVLNFGLSFPRTTTSFGWTNDAVNSYNTLKLFGHPGTFIMISALISYVIYRFTGNWKKGYGIEILKDTVRKTIPSSIALASMVTMALVMTESGMVELLARGSAKVASLFFPLISPLVGVLGAFMTGSNTSSNILFGVFQQQNALLLEINALIILAAQTTGGAIGNMLCPFNILLGTSTANMLGSEGEVMKRTTYVGISFAIFVGFLVLLLV